MKSIEKMADLRDGERFLMASFEPLDPPLGDLITALQASAEFLSFAAQRIMSKITI